MESSVRSVPNGIVSNRHKNKRDAAGGCGTALDCHAKATAKPLVSAVVARFDGRSY